MQSDKSQGAPSSLAIWAALLAVYIVWGSTYLAIRFAVQTMPPFLMASARFLVAGSVLYIWRRLKGDPAPTRIEWRSAAIVGLCLLLGGNGGVVWAGRRVDSGVSALLAGSTPLWMALIGATAIIVGAVILTTRRSPAPKPATVLPITPSPQFVEIDKNCPGH